VQNDLPRLKELGVSVLWFLPLYPIGKALRKGSLGSPYAICDYFTVNPEYGTLQEFRELVHVAHQAGFRVIIDMVLNHLAPDYIYLAKIPGLICRDKDGQPARKIADWTDVADINYENPESVSHVLDILKFWIRETDIDGYRCDVAGLVDKKLWAGWFDELNKIKPDLFFLAEWESPFYTLQAFHSVYDWSLNFLQKEVLAGNEPPSVLIDWVRLQAENYPANTLQLNFLENHDMERAVTTFGHREQVPFLIFNFSMPGLPLVNNGQEYGEERKPSLFEKEVIGWPDEPNDLIRFYQLLILLRKNEPALSSGFIEQYPVVRDSRVLVYSKKGTSVYLFILNFSNINETVELPPKVIGLIRNGQIMFTSDPQFEPSGNRLRLAPWQSIIMKTKDPL
jgi:glycosidase